MYESDYSYISSMSSLFTKEPVYRLKEPSNLYPQQ